MCNHSNASPKSSPAYELRKIIRIFITEKSKIKKFSNEERSQEFKRKLLNIVSFFFFLMNTYFLNYVTGVRTFKETKTSTTEPSGEDQ